MNLPWTIELFGHLRLQSGDIVHSRFYSQKVARLLARLAYHPRKRYGREELIEQFWPEGELDAGRTNLRSALASLRRQLEPPGITFGSVLVADYSHVSLNPDAVSTDVNGFEAAIERSNRASSPGQALDDLRSAAALYTSELLPGFYDDWILAERDRLASRYRSVLQRLRDHAANSSDISGALDYGRKLVDSDPLDEESHVALMELQLRSGQRKSAQQQYDRLWLVLEDRLAETPSLLAQRKAGEWGLKQPKPAAKHCYLRGTADKRPTEQSATRRSEPAVMPAPPQKLLDNNLPLTLTRFFGRDHELANLCDRLRSPVPRLLTLTGLGGVGKTRLAIEAARAFSVGFEGRALFVPLADLRSAELLPQRVLSICRQPSELPGADTMEDLRQILTETPALLVLDNFEHLIEGGISFVLRLLELAPSVKCLVTTRHRLQIEGEHVIPLGPLPAPQTGGDLEALSRCPSIQLLVDRAQSVRPDFQLTARNSGALVGICTELEGLPLALEIAAARVQVVTLAQMQVELRNRLDFLVHRKRGVVERHRSLRVALEWSFQLLDSQQQRFLTQLAVFRGGWTVEAAAAVCEQADALQRLEELHSCSLIVAEEDDEGIRFRMLETVRDYCADRIDPETLASLRRRHFQFYADWSEQICPVLRNGPDRGRRRRQLELEHGNLDLALTWCRDTEMDTEGLRLAGRLAYFWLTCGHTELGWAWLDYFLGRTSDSAATSQIAKALHSAGTLAAGQGDNDKACALFERALSMSQPAVDGLLIAEILNHYGFVLSRKGQYVDALHRYEESLACYKDLGSRGGYVYSLSGIARVVMFMGDLSRSSSLYEEGLQICRMAGLESTLASLYADLAALRARQEQYAEARQYEETAVRMQRDQGNRRELAYALEGQGQTLCRLNELQSAAASLEESHALFVSLKDRFGTADVLRDLAHLRFLEQRFPEAEALALESLALWQQQGLNHKIAIVCCLEVLGYTARHIAGSGRAGRGVSLLSAARALRTTEGLPTSKDEQCLTNREWDSLCASIPEQEFRSHSAFGEAMSWEQAVTFALSAASPSPRS